ncbi:methionine adenosyltransferase [Mobiluncus sp.]|uniref:methionine adenosyltransferase n=1 Tax=Mobiluncus sp. TaxID=47293 RepID=UPI002A90D2CE|nr:methionine adenosyltransferase [Mobiluncus sp.]MDY6077487.1 methionine adenosyltransferase [Mobiluncus sp.]
MSVRTAESVCIGHPDKLCDLIADHILDDILTCDPTARVAIEVMASGRRIIVTGEITTAIRPQLRACAREALRLAGYNPNRFLIYVWVRRQSADISAGETTSLEARDGDESAYATQGAGDQGTLYGYATNETPQRLPLPLVLAHDICRRLDAARTQGTITGIYSDGKAQVSVVYDELGTPVGIDTVVVSVQHDEHKPLDVLEREINALVVAPAIEAHLPGAVPVSVLVNPSGWFVTGGPTADTGLTGRKLMVDTYGGLGPHGGGAFSGKDASKVDRTGAYIARLIARTIVDVGLAEECHVSVSYAIGKANPVAFHVDTFGSGQHPDGLLTNAARAVFPLRPAAMIDALGLRAPVFVGLATYGHMGRAGRPWENTEPFINKLLEEVKDRADQAATDW